MLTGIPNADAPLTRRQIWTAYGHLSVFAYLLYALGSVTPYLRDDLGLTDFQAGLHASAMACGTLTAGITSDSTIARFGSVRTIFLAVTGGTVAALAIAGAPLFAVSLAAAFLIGLCGGTVSTYVNIMLGGSGGAEGRKLVARANAWSMAAALVSPVLIAGAASALHSWRLAMLAPAVAFAVFLAAGSVRRGSATMHATARQSLPRSFWLAWIFVVLAISTEFSFVFWGSTLVAERTGAAKETATLAAGLFVAGMLCGRVVVGLRRLSRISPRILLVAGLGLAAIGAASVWIATDPLFAAVGAFSAGCGVAGLYPVGVGVALASGGGAELAASARITLGGGIAIFCAPTLLGLLADAVGVVPAWSVVLGLVAVALVMALAATSRQPATPASDGMSNSPATERYRSPVS